jgi:2-polyprenyl-3-methyl-5-hydroxy-6-metoxy-1,4-benzoquinol methylase
MDRTRQYSTKISGIRPDHVKRYLFAARNIPNGSSVIDIACGCGYGSWLMKKSNHEVTGVDISREAIDFAELFYSGPRFLCQRAEDTTGSYDALVSFETLEHVPDPVGILKSIKAPLVIASVPNEELYPWSKERFAGDEYPHLRHYTPKEFEGLLNEAGIEVTEFHCQPDKKGEIFPGTDGMFLIAIGKR